MPRKSGKQYQAARKQVEAKDYLLEQAIPLIKKIKFAKFDETVEVHMRLGVDPKHADQMVRGTVLMPNGLGKSKKVLVIASGDKLREAMPRQKVRTSSPTAIPVICASRAHTIPCMAPSFFSHRVTV